MLLIDGILVRHNRVEIFADDPECILRASLRHLEAPMQLPDGAVMHSGGTAIEIHFFVHGRNAWRVPISTAC